MLYHLIYQSKNPFIDDYFSHVSITNCIQKHIVLHHINVSSVIICCCQDKAGTMAGCAGCVGRLLLLGCLVTLAQCDTNIRKS